MRIHKGSKSRKLPRRAALLGGAATAVGLLGCGGDGEPGHCLPLPSEGGEGGAGPGVARENRQLFPLGVQVGAVRDVSAVFWTFSVLLEPLTLQVWIERSDDGVRQNVQTAPALPGPDGYVHVALTGLEPGTRYEYAFFQEALGCRSAYGRLRTALAKGSLEPLLVGATSCTNFSYQPYSVLGLLARERLDLFLQLGDMSYNDGAVTLEDYRARWRRTLQDTEYRALLTSVGSYYTWDDHENTDDYDPERMASIDPERLLVARQAFFETLPIGRRADEALWQSFRWGSTAEIFILDSRSERLPSTLGSESPVYVSAEQLEWLQRGLEASTAHFKLVLTSVPIARFPQPIPWKDVSQRWEGYAPQREALLAFISEHAIRNVWFITGDFHLGMVHRVDSAGRDAGLWEIAVGPGGQGPHQPSLFTPAMAQERLAMFPPEQFLLVCPQRAATTFYLDPESDSVRVRFVAADGTVLFDDSLRQG